MKKLIKKYYLLLIWILLLTSMTGAVFFFPINLNEKYTCLYHRLYDNSDNGHAISLDIPAVTRPAMDHELLDSYIKSYAFLWWASMAVLFLVVIGMRKKIYMQKGFKK